MSGLEFAANWAQVLSLVLPFAVGFFGWVGKRWVESIVKEMSDKMDERTKPIQQGANGGWSLPDAIRILTKMEKKIDAMERDLAHLKGRFDNHIEEK